MQGCKNEKDSVLGEEGREEAMKGKKEGREEGLFVSISGLYNDGSNKTPPLGLILLAPAVRFCMHPQ